LKKSVKIETIKPNRIKLDMDFPDVISSRQSISTTLSAQWLYGSPAAGLKTRVEMDVTNMKTAFKGYENYQFDDRSNQFEMDEPVTVEGKTSAAGDVKLNFNWRKPTKTPGMLKVKFKTKIFEKGGDFSQDFLSKKYSPYSSYVGVKLPGGGNWQKH